jgi:hypothetical protein
MVAAADPTALTPEDGARLAAFFDCGACYIKLAASTSQPLHDIMSWALQPHIQNAIEVMQRAADTARRTRALAMLESLADQSTDPVEKRRAATAIVRITHFAHRLRPAAFGAPRTSFRTPAGLLNSTPGAPPPDIPAHFKRINTFVYSETPSRSLSAKQAVANALAHMQQGDDDALGALFNLSTWSGRFRAQTQEQFETLARERLKDQLQFQAAFAAPLLQTGRQSARQDVIIIPKAEGTPADPIAFTIHLSYPMHGAGEFCWLINGYSRSRLLEAQAHSMPPSTPAPEPDSS